MTCKGETTTPSFTKLISKEDDKALNFLYNLVSTRKDIIKSPPPPPPKKKKKRRNFKMKRSGKELHNNNSDR